MFDVLVLQNCIVVVQNTAKRDKKACCKCKFVFLLIRSIVLDVFSLPSPFSITRFIFLSIINKSFAISPS